MAKERQLLVVADDYGMGPETSRGILDLAARGLVTGTVLLVNSPFAQADVAAWRQAGSRPQLGWHPCLTLDAPILPPGEVSSLVGPDGRFHRLGQLLMRLVCRRIRPQQVEAEFRAQIGRFRDLVGTPPSLVNAHHHIQVFSPIGPILERLLAEQRPLPYYRRIREPWRLLATVPGARLKRTLLSTFGRSRVGQQAAAGLPGADWNIGITDPVHVGDRDFFTRLLRQAPGRVVELGCHPGHLDTTIAGRDCSPGDGHQIRRVREYHLLRHPAFRETCERAGFTLVAAADLSAGRICHAA